MVINNYSVINKTTDIYDKKLTNAFYVFVRVCVCVCVRARACVWNVELCGQNAKLFFFKCQDKWCIKWRMNFKVFKSPFEHEAEFKLILLPLFVRNVHIQTALCLYVT
jgi:hypothetical protein